MELRSAIATVALVGLPGTVLASGFALMEQNASGLGNAYAGQAASAQDASTVYFNPAGLLRIEGQQAVVVGHFIKTSAKFSDSGSTLRTLGDGGDAGSSAFLPNFYYARDAGPGFKFGLGVSAPFGLSTKYDLPWAGQTQAATSHLKVINVNPSLAWLYNEKVAVGAGINFQRAEAILSGSASAPAVNVMKMKGESDAWGYNFGVLFKLDNDTRVGFAYRSQVKHRLEGMANGVIPIQASLDTPASAALSLFTRLGERWDLLADMTWTGWSSFDKLEVRRSTDGLVLTSVRENWKDTARASVGANYRGGGKWLWRTGLAYDQTGIPNAEHRTPRLPDEDRIWLALGGQYKFSNRGWVDFGYAHLFIKDTGINHVENGIRLKGQYSSKVDVLSVQYTQVF